MPVSIARVFSRDSNDSRTMCGISKKTTSFCRVSLFCEEKKYLKNGSSPIPGVPLVLLLSCLVRMPARMLGSPSFSWMTCSLTFWPMTGSWTPLIVTVFVCDDTSIFIFSVISRS